MFRNNRNYANKSCSVISLFLLASYCVYACNKTNPNEFDDLIPVASDEDLAEAVFATRVSVAFEVQRGYVVVAARGARAILHRSP